MPAHLNAAPGHAVSAAQNILHPAAAGASGLATATDTPAGDSAPSFAALFRQLAAQPSGRDAGQIMLALQETPVAAMESTAAMTDALSALLPFLEGMGMIQPEGETAAEDAQAALPGSEDLANALAVPVTPAAAITAAAGVTGEESAEGNYSSATLATLSTATTASTASTAADAPDASIATLQDDRALRAIPATGTQAQALTQETQSGRGRDFASQLVAAIENDRENVQTEGSRTPGSTAHAAQQVIAATPSNGNNASSAVSALQITQPVGTSGWSEEVGNRVVWMANRQESRAELVLTPPQMGRVEVSLTISGDQASANFASTNPAVREALEAALPRLREVLADAGIQLGQAQVGAENPGQSARGDKNDDNPAFDRTGPRNAGPLQTTEVGMTSAAAGLKSGRGLVDVFA